jgi:hypothetical protein
MLYFFIILDRLWVLWLMGGGLGLAEGRLFFEELLG